jgi:uncharacterized protein
MGAGGENGLRSWMEAPKCTVSVEGAQGMVIVDVRCRLPRATDGGYFAARPGAAAPVEAAASPADDEARFVRTLDRAGVRTAVAVAGNNDGLALGHRRMPPRRSDADEQARLQRAYPGRYLGVAGIDPSGSLHDPLAEVRRSVEELGLRAVAIEPGREPFDAPHPADPRLETLYGLVQELGATLLLQTSGYYGGRNVDYANPRWIDQVAEAFPGLRIVCGHGCYPFARELVAVAVRRPNVYPSPDLYLYTPARREWTYAVNRGLIAGQLLFASGYPLGLPLAQSVRRFLVAGWRPRVLDRVLYRNALRAFALEDDPAFAQAAAPGRRYGVGSMLVAGVRLVLGEIARRSRARS